MNLFADLITNDEKAREYFAQINWVKGLARPVSAVRLGVGVQYRSGNYQGDPHPIGSPPQTPQMAQGSRFGGGRGAPGEPGGISGGPAFPGAPGEPGGFAGGGFGGVPGAPSASGSGGLQAPEIIRTTGELGEAVLAALQERFQSGAFGKILTEYVNSVGAAPAQGAGGGVPGYPGFPGFPGAPGGDDAAGAFPGAPPGFPGPGGAFPGYPGGAPAGRRGGSGGSGRVSAWSAKQLLPGFVSLGQASDTQDLLKKAQNQELDVLLVFEVEVEQNRRTMIVNNTVKMVLYNVETREPFRDLASKSLNNIQVARTRERTPDKDPVEEAVSQLMRYVDANLTLQDMPSDWNRETAIERIRKLLEAPNERTLQKLVEIRFYRSRQWLSNEELTSAYKHMLGGDEATAKKLATGSQEEKVKTMTKVLEKMQ